MNRVCKSCPFCKLHTEVCGSMTDVIISVNDFSSEPTKQQAWFVCPFCKAEGPQKTEIKVLWTRYEALVLRKALDAWEKRRV